MQSFCLQPSPTRAELLCRRALFVATLYKNTSYFLKKDSDSFIDLFFYFYFAFCGPYLLCYMFIADVLHVLRRHACFAVAERRRLTQHQKQGRFFSVVSASSLI